MKCVSCNKHVDDNTKQTPGMPMCDGCKAGKTRKTMEERITELETALSEALGSFGNEADKIVFSEKVEMWREVLNSKI